MNCLDGKVQFDFARRAAVVDFGQPWLKGRLAWPVWGIAHIPLPNRLLKPHRGRADWLWSYLTH